MKSRKGQLAIAALAGLAASVSAQAQLEIVSNLPGNFVDITATGTYVNLGDDGTTDITSTAGNSVLAPGGPHRITNNGAIAWNNLGGTAFTNAAIPSASLAGGAQGLAVYWDDLFTYPAAMTPAEGVYHQTIGGTLYVTWRVGHIIAPNSTGEVQLQVFSSGPIIAQFIYRQVDGYGAAQNNGASATVGYQTGAAPFNNVQFSFNTANSIQNGMVLSLVFSGPTGACCVPSGACTINTANGCATAGGIYRGDGTTCPANCPQPPTGACCAFSGSCTVVTQAQCASSGGTYRGDGTTCANPCPAVPPVIFGNCNLGTGPTTLSGVAAPAGSQWSECARDSADPTTANTTAGFGGTGALRLADDFVVPAGGMNIAYIRFPVYLTGATSVTCTAVTLQILNGPPNAGGTVIFGDPTTNRLANAEFAPYYRTFNTVTPPTCGGATTPPGTTRHIQWAYAAVNQTLPAGTYWLDWNYTGASFSPSSTAATAIGRQCNPNNSNALQFNAAWGPCNDIGQGCAATPVQQDMYFEILGTPGGPVCYPDCNGDHALNVNDFICFQSAFAANAPYADCNNDQQQNVNDFICFQSAFAAGCSQL